MNFIATYSGSPPFSVWIIFGMSLPNVNKVIDLVLLFDFREDSHPKNDPD